MPSFDAIIIGAGPNGLAAALRLAGQAGVRVLAYNCRVEEKGISWGHQLPVQLS